VVCGQHAHFSSAGRETFAGLRSRYSTGRDSPKDGAAMARQFGITGTGRSGPRKLKPGSLPSTPTNSFAAAADLATSRSDPPRHSLVAQPHIPPARKQGLALSQAPQWTCG